MGGVSSSRVGLERWWRPGSPGRTRRGWPRRFGWTTAATVNSDESRRVASSPWSAPRLDAWVVCRRDRVRGHEPCDPALPPLCAGRRSRAKRGRRARGRSEDWPGAGKPGLAVRKPDLRRGAGGVCRRSAFHSAAGAIAAGSKSSSSGGRLLGRHDLQRLEQDCASRLLWLLLPDRVCELDAVKARREAKRNGNPVEPPRFSEAVARDLTSVQANRHHLVPEIAASFEDECARPTAAVTHLKPARRPKPPAHDRQPPLRVRSFVPQEPFRGGPAEERADPLE